MSLAVVFAVAFFLMPTSITCARHHADRVLVSRGRLLATFIRQNVILVGILLFYVISSVPDLLRIINESMCWQAWSQCSTTKDACAAHHVDLFYYSVRVILTSLMVLMCWSFRGVVLCRNLFVTLGLATFAAAMSCLWFDTWLTESMENSKRASKYRHHHNMTWIMKHIFVGSGDDDNDNYADSYNRTMACLSHNTTVDNLLEAYERFFYPCTFELALLVIHCVVHWYSSSEPSSTSSCHQQPTEMSALLSSLSTDDSGVSVEDDVSVTSTTDTTDVSREGVRGQYSTSLILVTVLVNIVYCLIRYLGVYANVYYFDNLFFRIRLWYEIIYRTVLTTVLVVGLVLAGSCSRYSSSTATSEASKRQSHSGVEYLVLFTSWAPVVKSLLDIILYSNGSRDWITICVRMTYILGQTIAILHVAVQTVFVSHAKNFRKSEPSSLPNETNEWRRRRSRLQTVLLVVAVSNISLWATNSFVEINMAYGYSYHCMFYHDWIPIVSFVVPVAIFYYFNCALLCLDVFLNC